MKKSIQRLQLEHNMRMKKNHDRKKQTEMIVTGILEIGREKLILI